MSDFGIDLADIEAARQRIGPHIEPLQITASESLGQRFGKPILLAHEYLQTTGSFKLRGALNAVLQLDPTRVRGVTAVSTGNHGKALAWSARRAGIPCVVCMSSLVPEHKRAGIRALGAEVRIVGKSQDAAEVEAQQLVDGEDYVMIPPFDDPRVIAGQGTLALEMLEQVDGLDTLLVPLSGGGLISGIAIAAKAMRPSIRIVAVSMARGAAMVLSQRAGHPVEVEELPTLADSLAGGIGQDNRWTFPIVGALVDEMLLLEEDEIAAGIRHAYLEEQLVLEGGGAVGLGALLADKTRPGDKTLVLLSGGNIDEALHRKIVDGDRASPPH